MNAALAWPMVAATRWWARRCIAARLRWAEGDLAWLERQRELDARRAQLLRHHIEELRVQDALLNQ